MSLNALAEQYSCLVSIDRTEFQREARILQSMWRESRGFPIGEHRGRCLGSRLAMREAESFKNFLTARIADLAAGELALNRQCSKAQRKAIEPIRMKYNLLSSQPLCFNLFGELAGDLELCKNLLSGFAKREMHEVEALAFEYSPNRGDPRFTGDGTAFDVFVRYKTPQGDRGFIGIEVKYHEDLRVKPAALRPRYDELTKAMSCFKPECFEQLKRAPLQQLWRDHMLAGALLENDEYAEGLYVVLYPKMNHECDRVVARYGNVLSSRITFDAWSLEDFVESLRLLSQADWIRQFYDRYLDFDRVKQAL